MNCNIIQQGAKYFCLHFAKQSISENPFFLRNLRSIIFLSLNPLHYTHCYICPCACVTVDKTPFGIFDLKDIVTEMFLYSPLKLPEGKESTRGINRDSLACGFGKL